MIQFFNYLQTKTDKKLDSNSNIQFCEDWTKIKSLRDQIKEIAAKLEHSFDFQKFRE